jgi:hypothetical protein
MTEEGANLEKVLKGGNYLYLTSFIRKCPPVYVSSRFRFSFGLVRDPRRLPIGISATELAAEDEPQVVIRGRLDAAALEVALSQGEVAGASRLWGLFDCLTRATRLPQAILFLAAGNGLVTRGVPFFFWMARIRSAFRSRE